MGIALPSCSYGPSSLNTFIHNSPLSESCRRRRRSEKTNFGSNRDVGNTMHGQAGAKFSFDGNVGANIHAVNTGVK